MSATFSPMKAVGSGWVSVCTDDFNVSSHNARDILASLGLSPDFENLSPINLETFEADCLTFLRLAAGMEPDAELAEVVDGNSIQCGRRAGYMTDRVTSILALAQAGLAAGATHLSVA